MREVRLVRFRREKRARNDSTSSRPNNGQIWTVLDFAHFSALAAFEPPRDLKTTCRQLNNLFKESSTSRCRVRKLELWNLEHRSLCREGSRAADCFGVSVPLRPLDL